MKKVIFLMLVLSLTGCAFGTVEDMLSPPRMTEEQTAIYKALTDSRGTGFKLKYPRTGEHRSAFVLNRDAPDSAIVFYEITGINTERSLRMNFLYKNMEGKWEALHDFPITNATDIESVSFERFGEDEEDNIIVSYIVGQNEKRYMIITDDGNTPVKRHDDAYSFMQTDRYFNRDYKELLVIKNDRVYATAVFYTYKEGQLYLSGMCDELDPSAGEYLSVTTAYAEVNTPAIFIEHRKHENAENIGTDVIYYKSRTLVNPVTHRSENLEKVLRRSGITEYAKPMDIDGDGVFELASSAGEFAGYENLPHNERLRPVVWSRINIAEDRLEELYYSYYTEKHDYIFIFPPRWINSVTVSAEEDTVHFYIDAENPLLSIRTVADGGLIERGWELFKEGRENKLKYYIKSADHVNTPAMTADELEYAFRILSEIAEITETGE